MSPEKTHRSPLFREQDIDNLRWFWRGYLRDRAPWLLAVFAMVSLQGLIYQQFLALTENGMRVIFEEGSVARLIQVCVIVFVLFSARGLLSYAVPRLSMWLASEGVLRLRRDMIEHLLQLDLAYFERTKMGELLLRLVSQADMLAGFLGTATVNAVRDAATIVLVSAYLIWKSPLLFMAALIVIPTVILLLQAVTRKIKGIQAIAQTALGDYMHRIEEMATGMRTVKIAGQEDRGRDRLTDAASWIRDLAIRLQRAQALVLPALDFVAAFVYVLVIGGGGYMVLTGAHGLDSAALITFLLGLVLLFDPGRRLAQFFTALQANLVVLEGVRSLFHDRPTVVDAPDAVDTLDPRADFVFRDVRFGYGTDRPLFDGLDLTLRGGTTTAIVGPTGSGKTTILSLLTRLYDVDGGAITLGGTDLRKLRVKALRGSFSVVAQDIVIFNASIWENIRYVRPDATEAEIWAAAEAAEIAELIHERGDAPLGPKGSQLSGGQKQRIAIARAFLRSAPILLLDEATSALDAESERAVQVAVERLAQGRTTLIVAHRLATVKKADRIVVFEGGRIVAMGTHDALVAGGGLYARLARLQFTEGLAAE